MPVAANIVLTLRDGPHRYFYTCAPGRESELCAAINEDVTAGHLSLPAAVILSEQLLIYAALRLMATRPSLPQRALRYLRSLGGGR